MSETEPVATKTPAKRFWWVGIAAAAIVAAAIVAAFLGKPAPAVVSSEKPQHSAIVAATAEARSPALDSPAGVSSDKLSQTAIVPTLDTPMPARKNVIWCSSFQIAWNHLKDDVIKEPINLAASQSIANRLNAGKETEADLTPGSFYAAAGWVKDGIVQTIQQEMKKRFPDVPTPTFNSPDLAAVAYAYLANDVKFDPPYIDNKGEMTFTSSDGSKSFVRSFGILPAADDATGLRERIQVLYAQAAPDVGKFPMPDFDSDEFAIDPNKGSQPNQIILARITPKPTLAETLADVEGKMGRWKSPNEYVVGYVPGGHAIQELLIPDTAYRIDHHFAQLEGPTFLNKTAQNLFIAEAFQMIDFRMSREGARLKSEARLGPAPSAPEGPGPRLITHFIFNRPFLIFMKKRGAERPYFVMWVDNPELLMKW